MFNEINLANFKCHKKLNMQLSNLNVLTGVNSTGKSTIIQAILLVKQSVDYFNTFTRLKLNGDFVKIGKGKDVLNISAGVDDFVGISIKYSDAVDSTQYAFDSKYKYESEKTELDLVNEKKLFATSSNQSHNANMRAQDLLRSIFSKHFTIIGADRIGPRGYYVAGGSNTETLGYRGENTIAYLSGLEKRINVMKELLHPNNKSKEFRDQVSSWLGEISHQTQFNAVTDNSIGISTIKFGEFLPTNVGFGVSYTLPIIVALLKSQKGDVLIIENPEAHLHPKGQRRLGELIAKVSACGVQVFIETHSDHIINGFRLAVKRKEIEKEQIKLNYFYAKADDKGEMVFDKCSPEILDDGSMSSWPEGFFDEWDKAITDLY